MRYVTATVGAVFMFVAVLLVCLVTIAFLPPAFKPVVRVGFVPWINVWINNPLAFVGLGLAVLAAAHSFRSTLKRYAAKENASVESRVTSSEPPRSE
jgi:hypothetical protein